MHYSIYGPSCHCRPNNNHHSRGRRRRGGSQNAHIDLKEEEDGELNRNRRAAAAAAAMDSLEGYYYNIPSRSKNHNPLQNDETRETTSRLPSRPSTCAEDLPVVSSNNGQHKETQRRRQYTQTEGSISTATITTATWNWNASFFTLTLPSSKSPPHRSHSPPCHHARPTLTLPRSKSQDRKMRHHYDEN